MCADERKWMGWMTSGLGFSSSSETKMIGRSVIEFDHEARNADM